MLSIHFLLTLKCTKLNTQDHFNVSFEAEWIANSTKQTGSRNFGFQLPRASQSLIV
jgi:hypothetical protein